MDASPYYPDFSFKTLAPRVDLTRGTAPEARRFDTRQAARDDYPGRERSTDLADAFSPTGSRVPTSDADVDRAVERLYREIERRMRIERERRGL